MSFKKLRRSRTAVVGVCCALAGAAVVPVISLAGSITGSTGDGPMVLQSGTTNLQYESRTNIASVDNTAYSAPWSRVGDTVTMSGAVRVTPAAANVGTSLYLPLPVDSNISYNTACLGTGNVSWPSVTTARIYGSADSGHTHQCILEWIPTNAGQQYVTYTVSYRVRD